MVVVGMGRRGAGQSEMERVQIFNKLRYFHVMRSINMCYEEKSFG